MAEVLDKAPLTARAQDDERKSLVRSIAGYLIPRLERPDAPLLVALAGADGVGKSHVMNGLVDAEISPEGAIRPTTTSPVLVASDDGVGGWDELLRRLLSAAPDLQFQVAEAPLTKSVSFVDLPATLDLPANRPVLGLADLVLVVVTPTRYADVTTWDLIAELRSLAIPTWIVMNQVTGVDDPVIADLEQRLRGAGYELPVHPLPSDTQDPVAGLRAQLAFAAGDGRTQLIEPALRDRNARVLDQAAALTVPLGEALVQGEELGAAVDAEYAAAAESVSTLILSDGLGPGAAAALWADVADRLAGVVTRRIGVAAERTATAWRRTREGAAILSHGGHDLWRHPPDTARETRNKLLEWEATLGPMVARHTRRQLNAYKLGQVVAAVKARALGDTGKARRRVRRRLKDGIDPAAAEARRSLAGVATSMVMDDKQRFKLRMGPRPTAEAVAELRTLVASFDVELPAPSLHEEATDA